MNYRIRFFMGLAIIVGILAALWIVAYTHNRAHAASYDYSYVNETAMPGVQNYGQTTNVQITLQNTGTSAWERDSSTPVRLGTSHPQDGSSGFCTPPYYSNGWLPGCNRIQLPQAEVLPGQQVTFSFTIASPDYGGLINQYFQPVVDGVTWMKDIGLYLGTTFPAPRWALLFTWYGPGCSGWTPACGDATTNPVDTPQFGTVTGPYDSADVNVIRQQLNFMRDAGVNIIGIDWWGNLGPGRDVNHQRQASTNVINTIIAEYPTLKFALFDEPDSPFSGNQTPISPQDYNFAASYMNDSHYFKYMGKPLIMTFFGKVAGSDARFNVITLSNGRTSFGYPDWWTNANQPTITSGVASIASRFDNTHWCTAAGQACMSVDPTYANDFFGQQMNYALSQRNNIRLLLENSPNEEYERQNWFPHIDPTSAFPADNAHAYNELQNYNNNRWTQP